MKNRITKGHFGYLKYRQKSLLIRSLILLAGAAGIVIIGLVVTKTTKNWMTIFGCLTAIPMAMSIATLLTILKYKGAPEEEYLVVKQVAGEGILDVDLLVANKDGAAFQFYYGFVHETGVFLFTRDLKMDVNKTAEYVRNFLRLNKCDGPVQIYNNFDSFLRRIQNCTPSDRNTCEEKLLEQEGILRAISM